MKKPLLLFITLLFTTLLFAQTNQGLYHFSFKTNSQKQLNNISRIISIDNVENGTVIAFASPKEFEQFLALGINYTIIEDVDKNKVINMASSVDQMSNWDRYPTYEVYVQMMEDFASTYPGLCKLEEIGTLSSGRKLLALKISDNVELDNEPEPELLYTSSMHGDELTGAILLLRLTDYLLRNYGNASYPQVTNLLNETEIWINPLANPDGTYYGGNSTVSSARRYNANSVDVNRNFPDPQDGEHPDGNSWQEETQLMMTFAENHHFSLSANFHGGVEVINYPWDTWSKLTADDAWWQYVSREYADLAQENSPAGYMTALNNGITNGYVWYEVAGGRQDYMNYVHNCREVTIELSDVKLISSDELPAHWDYNKESLLAYLNQGRYGVRGKVTDGQGNPLSATVTIYGHDEDNSWVTTDVRAGDYARYLKEGVYDFTFSSEGFVDYLAENVEVVDGQLTELDIVMGLPEPELHLNKEEILHDVVLDETETEQLIISNVGYADLTYYIEVEDASTHQWISVDRNSGIISASSNQTVNVTFDATGLSETTYSCNLLITGDSLVTIPVTMSVYTEPKLQLNKTSCDTTLLINQTVADIITITNTGNADLNYTAQVHNPTENAWLTIGNSSGIIIPGASDDIQVNYNPEVSGIGFYSSKIVIGGDIPIAIPVTMQVDTLPYFQLINEAVEFEQLMGESAIRQISLKNKGGGWLDYSASINYTSGNNWISLSDTTGQIAKGQSLALDISGDFSNVTPGYYEASVTLISEFDTLTLPVQASIDTLPEFWMNTSAISHEVFEGAAIKDTLVFANLGGGAINFTPEITYSDGATGWVLPGEPTVLLEARDTNSLVITLDARALEPGTYQASFSAGPGNNSMINITFEVIALPSLDVNVFTINQQVMQDDEKVNTVLLTNTGGGVLNYQVTFDATGSEWASANKSQGAINGGITDTLLVNFSAQGMEPGTYSGKLIITTTQEKRIPISMTVIKQPQIGLSLNKVDFSLQPDEEQTEVLRLTNYGGGTLDYELNFSNGLPDWLTFSGNQTGSLSGGSFTDLEFTATGINQSPYVFDREVLLSTNVGDSTLKFHLDVLVGLNNKEEKAIAVYPNPFTNKVYFSLSNRKSQEYSLQIYNSIGVLIYRETGSTGIDINWKGQSMKGKVLPLGNYIYRLTVNDKVYNGLIQKR